MAFGTEGKLLIEWLVNSKRLSILILTVIYS